MPITKELLRETASNDKELGAAEAGLYRRGVGIVLYVLPDRVDIQFALSELTRLMKTPTERGMAILRRVVRYFAVHRCELGTGHSRSEVGHLWDHLPPRSCVAELCAHAERGGFEQRRV